MALSLHASAYNSCIEKGNAAIKRKDDAAALKWYRQAYEKRPSEGLAGAISGLEYNIHMENGIKAHDAGDYAKSLAFLVKGYAIKQDDANVKKRILRLCGILGGLAYNSGDAAAALEYFKLAAKHERVHWQAWRGLAACSYELGDHRDALGFAERAYKLNRGDASLACLRDLVAWRLGQGEGRARFKDYKVLNDSEKRFAEFKDSDEMLWLKLRQLDYINRSRAGYGAPALRLDILASRVANSISREACLNNFVGHWNLRGEKPYHRYAFAGGLDHVGENGAMRGMTPPRGMTAESVHFISSPDNYMRLMMVLHDGFMAERAPNDGHKQNCISRSHNYVGIGCYMKGNQFRYYEEYIDRYIEFIEVNAAAAVGETVSYTLKPLQSKRHLFMVVVFYEPFPRPLTPKQASGMGQGVLHSYGDFSDEVVLKLSPWQLKRHESSGAYTFPVEFKKAGLYYLKAYLSERRYRPDEKSSTAGKLEGSGIVVRVE